VLKNYKDVKKRWKEYFEKLLNEECPREAVEDGWRGYFLARRFNIFN